MYPPFYILYYVFRFKLPIHCYNNVTTMLIESWKNTHLYQNWSCTLSKSMNPSETCLKLEVAPSLNDND